MMTLEELGVTKEELQDRVVAKIADSLLSSMVEWRDEETGDEGIAPEPSQLQRLLETRCREMISTAVTEMGDKLVLPRVNELIEGCVLQKTNEWGEKTGKPVTFTEYLVNRAERYITEEVNFEGKNKDQNGSYSFSKAGTRIAYMIDKHLQYSIQNAITAMLKDANSQIADGITKTIKIKMEEVLSKVKVTTSI